MALDTIETPAGSAVESLGGSATFASLAARLFTEPYPVAVVGSDFPDRHLRRLQALGVSTHGIARQEGKTFRWHGRYEAHDLNTAMTISTELNVFRSFNPQLSSAVRGISHALLANIDPDLQWSVLQQLWAPKCVAIDSMNFWINTKRDALRRVMSRAHVIFLNEGEAKLLSGKTSLIHAMRALVARPAQAIVVKLGEHGCVAMHQARLITLPAYLVPKVADPTGAGDAFAGTVMGYLAKGNHALSWKTLQEALQWGTVVASFTVEQLGTGRLSRLTVTEARKRLKEFSTRLGMV